MLFIKTSFGRRVQTSIGFMSTGLADFARFACGSKLNF